MRKAFFTATFSVVTLLFFNVARSQEPTPVGTPVPTVAEAMEVFIELNKNIDDALKNSEFQGPLFQAIDKLIELSKLSKEQVPSSFDSLDEDRKAELIAKYKESMQVFIDELEVLKTHAHAANQVEALASKQRLNVLKLRGHRDFRNPQP